MRKLNLGLLREKFRRFEVVGRKDLLPVGQGKRTGHSVVAVAHCDSFSTTDRTCARFAGTMRKKRVSECVVIQNSWGEKANARGYGCLSKQALARMLKGAYLSK